MYNMRRSIFPASILHNINYFVVVILPASPAESIIGGVDARGKGQAIRVDAPNSVDRQVCVSLTLHFFHNLMTNRTATATRLGSACLIRAFDALMCS